MNSEPDTNLERLIQQELQNVPDLKAPATLMQRVMARIEAGTSVPWWRQAWLGWPLSAQLASLALFAGLLAVSAFSLGEVDFASYGAQAWAGFQSLSVLWDKLAALLNAAVLVNRAFAEHLLIWVLPVLMLLAFAAAAAGSGLWRLTLRENKKF